MTEQPPVYQRGVLLGNRGSRNQHWARLFTRAANSTLFGALLFVWQAFRCLGTGRRTLLTASIIRFRARTAYFASDGYAGHQ